MKLNRIFLGVLAVMFVLEQAYAQPIGNKPTPEMKHDIGDQQSDKKDAYTALEWYNSAYENDNTDASAVYKIASTHESLRDYKSAAAWYQKLVDLDKDQLPTQSLSACECNENDRRLPKLNCRI